MSHINKLIDFTVEAFIVHKNKVLLRKHDKYKMWLGVGGHIELHEDPVEATVREAREEVGLEIELDEKLKPSRKEDTTTDLIPPYYLHRHRVSGDHEHVSFVYFAKATTDKITQGIDELSEECRWFTKEEIEESKEIKSDIKFYALKALEKT